WRRDTVYRNGAFRVERIWSDHGIGGYHAYYGPFRTNMYEWHENGGWRAFRLTDLNNVDNPDCAAGIERIDGFDPRRLCWSFHWPGDRAVGARRERSDQTTSMRVTGTTAVTVHVNGSDYRLPAYTVERSYAAGAEGRSEVALVYVPALGEFVEWEGRRIAQGRVSRSSGRVLSTQVSAEVLEQVQATALP